MRNGRSAASRGQAGSLRGLREGVSRAARAFERIQPVSSFAHAAECQAILHMLKQAQALSGLIELVLLYAPKCRPIQFTAVTTGGAQVSSACISGYCFFIVVFSVYGSMMLKYSESRVMLLQSASYSAASPSTDSIIRLMPSVLRLAIARMPRRFVRIVISASSACSPS